MKQTGRQDSQLEHKATLSHVKHVKPSRAPDCNGCNRFLIRIRGSVHVVGSCETQPSMRVKWCEVILNHLSRNSHKAVTHVSFFSDACNAIVMSLIVLFREFSAKEKSAGALSHGAWLITARWLCSVWRRLGNRQRAESELKIIKGPACSHPVGDFNYSGWLKLSQAESLLSLCRNKICHSRHFDLWQDKKRMLITFTVAF